MLPTMTLRLARLRASALLLVLMLCHPTSAVAWEFYIDSLEQPVDATGVWRFHTGDDMAWAEPDYDHSRWDNILVPRDWRRQGYKDYTGMAWYRATFVFDLSQPGMQKALDQLGISLGKIHSAYEMYVNGKLLRGAGRLPPDPAIVYDRIRTTAIPRSAIDDQGRMTVAVRVWRDEVLGRASTSGMYESPVRVGRILDLTKRIWFGEVLILMLVFCYIAFGLYHLYLYVRNRRSPDFFWFGVTTLMVALYTLEISQWKHIVDVFSFEVNKKIEYVTIYLMPAVGLELVYSLLQRRPLPYQRAYQGGFVILALVALLVPGQTIHTQTLFIWQLYVLPALLGLMVQVIWEAAHGNIEARTMLLGWGLFVAAALNDILVAQGTVQNPRVLHLGFAAVLITMGLSLANRFSRMYNHLETEVQARTRELLETNEKLVDAARLDALTGLLNRRGFAEKIETEIARVARTRRGFVMLMVDIDHFKVCNDTHGHACGDKVLKETARVLQAQLRDVDTIARWGGEEFIFLLPETTLNGGAVLAEKLRAAVESQRFSFEKNIRLNLTITVGVAQFEDDMSFDDCLARADHALYDGKLAGRNRVVVDVISSTHKSGRELPASA
jgi:diguanylate cyclase (GGDEF)-like protein